jgi:uncharacterized integral membrane protein (TIGR00698 family)
MGIKALVPGLLLCIMLALSATFVSEHYGGPQLLYALLFGLAMHFLSKDPKARPGIDFCGRTLLRAGVALLGFRITFDQVSALGWPTAVLVVVGVVTTMALGVGLARFFGRPVEEGVISGGAVGICGASAALTLSSVLPQTRENERFTLLAVVGVTLMSTLAMVLYPLAAKLLALSPAQSGLFFGATIHDVAQVVAAGSLLSTATDTTAVDTATIVKLFRVMLLMPMAILIASLFRAPAVSEGDNANGKTAAEGDSPAQTVPLIPGFLLAFIVFMLLGTANALPAQVPGWASQASRAFLVVAIAAAGVKTSFEDLLKLGWAPVWMLTFETLWIALFALVGILVLAH